MSATHLSPSVLPSHFDGYDDTVDEGRCQSTQIIVGDISRGSLVSDNNDDGGRVTYHEDEDDFCPICYEVYAIHPSSTQHPKEDEVTRSTHEENFDYDSDDCKSDLDLSPRRPTVEIDMDVDQLKAQTSLHTSSHLSTTSRNGENDLERNHTIYSKGQHTNHQRKSCCDPLEKVIIPGCGHEFCRGCLKDHCSYSISIRDLPIRCPKYSGDDSSVPCSGILSTEIVREALLMEEISNPDWIKFQRLQRMLEDPTLIPCTRCDELVSPKHKDGSSNLDDPNRAECPSCQHIFCRVHGDSHLGKDCDEANLLRDENDPSELAILELCKPCSHCRVPIFKEEGCNHVVCPVCKDDMCFNCGSHEHLENKGKTVRICKNCNGSYFDHRYIWRHRLGVVVTLPFMIPIYAGYMAMALALATVSCGCFCCLGCGVRVKETTKMEQHPKQEKSDRSKKVVFMPIMALREVLGWLLLPFIDLFRKCRIPCCFCHNAPGLCKGRPTDNDDDDDDYEESDYNTAKEDDSALRDVDVENQLGEQ